MEPLSRRRRLSKTRRERDHGCDTSTPLVRRLRVVGRFEINAFFRADAVGYARSV